MTEWTLTAVLLQSLHPEPSHWPLCESGASRDHCGLSMREAEAKLSGRHSEKETGLITFFEPESASFLSADTAEPQSLSAEANTAGCPSTAHWTQALQEVPRAALFSGLRVSETNGHPVFSCLAAPSTAKPQPSKQQASCDPVQPSALGQDHPSSSSSRAPGEPQEV